MLPELNQEINHTPQPLLIVLSGLSAAGKDSVIRRLMERNLPLYFTVNATTRAPRPGEKEGVDYFFVSTPEFQNLIENGELLEHSDVYGDMKGILRREVLKGLDMGRDVVLRIDVQGATKIRAICPDALLIFLTTPSLIEQSKRLAERASEDQDSLQTRILTAREEMSHLPEFDYLVINYQGKLDETVDLITAIIQAEHLRVNQRKICLE